MALRSYMFPAAANALPHFSIVKTHLEILLPKDKSMLHTLTSLPVKVVMHLNSIKSLPCTVAPELVLEATGISGLSNLKIDGVTREIRAPEQRPEHDNVLITGPVAYWSQKETHFGIVDHTLRIVGAPLRAFTLSFNYSVQVQKSPCSEPSKISQLSWVGDNLCFNAKAGGLSQLLWTGDTPKQPEVSVTFTDGVRRYQQTKGGSMSVSPVTHHPIESHHFKDTFGKEATALSEVAFVVPSTADLTRESRPAPTP